MKTEGLAEGAYKLIREAIIAGQYPEGARLREEELATATETSRTPVREALRRLAAEGFVEMRPRVGAVVKMWDSETVRDLFDLRAILEGYAASLAALRMSDANIEELAAASRGMIDLLENQTDDFLKAFSEANTAFHCRILTLSGNRQLEALAQPLIDLALIMRTYRKFSPERMGRSCSDHEDLVAAFRRRDARWAEAIMRAHILASLELAAAPMAAGPPLQGSLGHL